MHDPLAARLVPMLCGKRQTVSTAESCTGGLVGKKITDISGSSAAYPGGVISYCNDVKQRVLGVSQELLDRLGAVSEPVALEMAQGIRRVMETDFGLSVTGIAGPNSDETGKPVGLVYIGIADKERAVCYPLQLEGTRAEIREQAAHTALRYLIEFIEKTQCAI